MPVWLTTPIEETPELVLTQWLVMELPDGDHHFVGYNLTEGEGRVSSKILEFDKSTMIGKTRSGRTYKLQGAPSLSLDAWYVWETWKRLYGITESKEVSDQYYEEKED